MGKPLAQVHEQRQQAECGQQRHANAPQHQQVVNVLPALGHFGRFQLEQFASQLLDGIHVLLANAAHDDLGHRLSLAVVVQADGDRKF